MTSRLGLSFYLIFALGLINQACARDQGDSRPHSSSESNSAADAEDRTLLAVSKAIRRGHLTTLADQCLAYEFDSKSSSSAYIVEVRENHKHASCGGDPNTQPRLFTVKVNRKTQKMLTDAGSPGTFRPIPD